MARQTCKKAKVLFLFEFKACVPILAVSYESAGKPKMKSRLIFAMGEMQAKILDLYTNENLNELLN